MVIRQCVICGKEFDTKNRSGSAITCSAECSRERQKERQRIYDRKRDPIRNQRSDRKKQLRQWYHNNRGYFVEYRDKHPEKYHKTKREKETPGLKEVNIIARQNANYQCELSGQQGALNVHHLNGYAYFPNQRTDLNNLIVLHTDIHKDFHSIYGYKGNNTIDQFSEFVYQNFPLQFDQFRMSKYKYLPEHTYNT